MTSRRPGATPLILAASRGHHDVTKVLLETGAVLSAVDELGMMAAYYAQVHKASRL